MSIDTTAVEDVPVKLRTPPQAGIESREETPAVSDSVEIPNVRTAADLAVDGLEKAIAGRTASDGPDEHQVVDAAVVAAGGWRRLVLGLLVGVIFGALVALVLPRESSEAELAQARNDDDPDP